MGLILRTGHESIAEIAGQVHGEYKRAIFHIAA